MPELQEIKKKAIVFADVHQVTHSGWTIGGMVASQCGVPLFSVARGNSLSVMNSFMSSATCMGDILRQHDYQLNYMGGADSEFGGKKNFYLSHGFE